MEANLEQWAAQQAREIVEMVENLYNNPLLPDLVKARVLVIEARGAMRESNEERERVLSKLKGTIEDKVFEKDETIFDWLYNEIESLRAGDE